MKLNVLTLKDKKIFSRFLTRRKHSLSVYAFENIYIWKALYNIKWAVIDESLCIFFQDGLGCFLYLPPLSTKQKEPVLKKAFEVMDGFNRNAEFSRIENIESQELESFKELGYLCNEKPGEYLCLRQELSDLSGVKFKSKRACFNYFIKHYPFEYLPFSLREGKGCLELYEYWMKSRWQKCADHIYQGMLEDSFKCLKKMLMDYRGLDIRGSIVRIGKELKGFTFGFKLSADTFCILYEVTDLSVKGLAQFIFRRFCAELKDYKYINIMDDSGLKNLKQVKLSYHPHKLVPAYIAQRKDA